MTRNRYYQGPPSDHFDGERFFNPGHPSTDRSLADLLRWRFAGSRTSWPAEATEAVVCKPAARVEGLSVTMVGHASVLIQAAGLNLLLDPVWSERASPVRFAGPRRASPPGIAWDDLPPIDVVLVTHSHYDHLDAATLARLRAAHHPRIIAPLGMDAVIARAVPGCAVEARDWGDRLELAPGVAVTLHPAHHWSARGMGDRRMALWCGFVIEAPPGVLYVPGDTGYGDGAIFRQVRERFGAPVAAILPIGAYEPRWFMRDQHVDPEEAVRILLACGAEQGLGVHWGTFQLTDEPRLAPVQALGEACRRHGLAAGRFLALTPGQRWTAPGIPPHVDGSLPLP